MNKAKDLGKLLNLSFTLLLVLGFFSPSVSLSAGCGVPALTLVKRGQPSAIIVIPVEATISEQKAASDLQKFLYKMTSATLPIKKDNESISGIIVSVGLTKYVSPEIKNKLKINAELSIKDPLRDSFIISTQTNALLLVGHSDQGTKYSVFHLLENLGCRWFFGCKAGEVIPKALTIAVPIKDDDFNIPDFAYRVQFHWGQSLNGSIVSGYPQDWLISTNGTAVPDTDERDWYDHNLLSPGYVPGDSGHNFHLIWPLSLFDTHPEYFGEIEGVRSINAQPCLSNPEVIQLGINWAENQLKAHPEYRIITFAPRDGNPYCKCPHCLGIGNPADQLINFANQVTRALKTKYPDKMVAIWAYADSAVSPTIKVDGYDQGQDHVLVILKKLYSKLPFNTLIQAWSNSTHNIFIYTYTDWYHYKWQWGAEGNPIYYIDEMQISYPAWKNEYIRLIANQTERRWGKVGFSRYIQAKKFWNVNADIKALQWDFAQKMFPSAPISLYNYTSLSVELFSETHFSKPETNHREFLRQAYSIFDVIRQKIKTPEEKMRWQWYALYLHEQLLEYNLRMAPTDRDKLVAIEELVRYLKGTNSFNITDAFNTIWYIYAPRIINDKSHGGLGISEFNNLNVDIRLRNLLPDFPAQNIDLAMADQLFSADKIKVSFFEPPASVEILQQQKAKFLSAEGWNTPTGITRPPKDFTPQDIKIDFDLPWMNVTN